MVRGTTPDFILTIDGLDLTGQTVFVTIKQRPVEITKTNDDLTITVVTSGTKPNSEIEVLLSQEETLSLREGDAEVQVRWIGADGYADATETATFDVYKVLLERVIEYGM